MYFLAFLLPKSEIIDRMENEKGEREDNLLIDIHYADW